MSDDLISRAKALEAISDLYWMDERLLNFRKEIDEIFDKVRDLPSAERRGKWIHLDSMDERHDELRCPFCHKDFTVDAYRMCDIGFTAEDLKHCPNCGAKMEEESNEID